MVSVELVEMDCLEDDESQTVDLLLPTVEIQSLDFYPCQQKAHKMRLLSWPNPSIYS